MTNAISSGTMQAPPPPPPRSKPSEEQLTALEELLAEYDAETLSDEDAAELVTQISELGIGRSKELAETLTNAGFDPQALAQQAHSGGATPPPPPPQSSGINNAAISALTKLLEESGQEQFSKSDMQDFLAQLQESGFDTSKPLIDISA